MSPFSFCPFFQAATKAKAHRVRVGFGVLLLRRDLWIDSRCRDCYGALGSQFARCAISQETHSGLFLWLGRSGRRDRLASKSTSAGVSEPSFCLSESSEPEELQEIRAVFGKTNSPVSESSSRRSPLRASPSNGSRGAATEDAKPTTLRQSERKTTEWLLGRIERLVPASERDSELIVTAAQHDLEPASICRNVPDGARGLRPRRNESPLFYGLIPSTVGRIRPLGDRAGALVGGHAPINQIPRS